MHEVTFPSGDHTIHGSLALPNSSGLYPGVIIFHGMTASEEGYTPLVAQLEDSGIAGLAISMRAHGQSTGKFNVETVRGAFNDGLAAYDFLSMQKGIDSKRIGVVGSSVGAVLAANLIANREVASLIFKAPAVYTEEMLDMSMAKIMEREVAWFSELQDVAATPTGKSIADYNGNLLIVPSEHDDVIPSTITDRLLEVATQAKSKKLITIQGADHPLSDPKWKQEFRDIATEWFKKTLFSEI
jgi:dienelactone hydrolase